MLVLIGILACGIAPALAFKCECGVFVPSMFPGLSLLDPLNYLPEGDISGACDLEECRSYCTGAAPQFDYDLNINQGGQPRGELYCEIIDELYGGDGSVVIDDEDQFVTSKMSDCDTFFVWDTFRVYTTEPTLCCQGSNWC